MASMSEPKLQLLSLNTLGRDIYLRRNAARHPSRTHLPRSAVAHALGWWSSAAAADRPAAAACGPHTTAHRAPAAPAAAQAASTAPLHRTRCAGGVACSPRPPSRRPLARRCRRGAQHVQRRPTVPCGPEAAGLAAVAGAMPRVAPQGCAGRRPGQWRGASRRAQCSGGRGLPAGHAAPLCCAPGSAAGGPSAHAPSRPHRRSPPPARAAQRCSPGPPGWHQPECLRHGVPPVPARCARCLLCWRWQVPHKLRQQPVMSWPDQVP